MGPCVLCGVNEGREVESILINGNNAAVVRLGKNYCIECAGKRVEELRNLLKTRKNILSISVELKFFEELKIIEV